MRKLPLTNQFYLRDILYSKEDKTVKYVFSSNGFILEFTWIDKNDSKAIICVPTQTNCRLGCQFCHLTGLDIPVHSLTPDQITQGIQYVLNHQKETNPKYNKENYPILLISFMGCGEPLNNINGVIDSAKQIRDLYKSEFDIVRFAVASLIPTYKQFEKFKELVVENNLPIKFHWSLHTTNVGLRKQIMPGAAEMNVPIVSSYTDTGNALEIHYTIMDEVNDSDEDANKLIDLFSKTKANIKLMRYSEKKDLDLQRSKKVGEFMDKLIAGGIKTEYYEPPGNDVGSSCGQFLLNHYKEYND
jgi:23S rRNA (adenine2503-C2)-methyltransferase